ncbi:MAG: hypothetical protein C0518_06145 [Opitutus sp.]|nr:hypothetical protein [Opitutus sp.]
MAKSLAAATVLLLLPACRTPDHGGPFAGPFDAGTMAEPRNQEASGLAVSRRAANLLWIHEDSGRAPELHALDEHGARRGRILVAGAENIDWEDVASFTLEGRAWLCVADVGDNNAQRPFVQLHFIEEPDPTLLSPDQELTLRPTFSLQVSYEDGPRDCESVAVDARERAVYLLSKRDAVPRLYRVPLAAAARPVVARKVGEAPHFPKPNQVQRVLKIPTGLYRASPCAMDFAADGSGAVVLTYGDTLYFPRATGESWPTALAREPVVLGGHGLLQAEAVAFARDGRSIFVCSEGTMRLLRYDRR